jgi:hypothetical protein
MGTLVVGLMRMLPVCAVVLALPTAPALPRRKEQCQRNCPVTN